MKIWIAGGALALGFCVTATRPVAQDINPNNPVLQDDKEDESPFRKGFKQRVEEAVDKGCDWLKKQQGIDANDAPELFGKMPPNPPTYGGGTPHQYRIARTAFPIQALCKSGVFHDDPAIQRAMEYLRKNYKKISVVDGQPGGEPSTTYEDATVLNAIEAYYISAWEAKDRGFSNPKKRYKKVDGKKIPIKRWGTEDHGAKKKKKKRNYRLAKEDRKICEIAIKGLEKRFRRAYGAAGWRYAYPNMGETKPQIDISATQYAMLGLKAATRLGIEYDKKMVMDAFHFFRKQQDKDGPKVVRVKEGEDPDAKEKDDKKKDDKKKTSSKKYKPHSKDRARGWGYCRQDEHLKGDASTYGSMTAAGICALILIRDELEDDRALSSKWKKQAEECDQMIYDGLAWMVMNWTLENNPKRGSYRYYYYLYTVERLGMLGQIDFIGQYDWYFEGAEIILKQQDPSGMWDPQNEIDPSDIYNTCYALLFLKKATSGIDRPIPVISGRDGG